jgi:hypothetical protein
LEAGIMLDNVMIDGTAVRAGITFDAFDILMARAGYDAAENWGEGETSDLVARLLPSIEAHLQSKHFRAGSADEPLIIGVADVLAH